MKCVKCGAEQGPWFADANRAYYCSHCFGVYYRQHWEEFQLKDGAQAAMRWRGRQH